MKKPSLHTAIMVVSVLIAIGTVILRLSHVISSYLAFLLIFLVFILQFIANRLNARQKNRNA